MPDPLPLSAVEALVLLKPRAQGRDALKLAMMTLIAQGAVEIVEARRRVLGFQRRVTELRRRGSQPTPFPGAFRLLDLIGSAGCPMPEFVARVRRAYGTKLQGYIRHAVRPELLRRGLLVERRQPFLLFFARTRRELTEAGETERERIERAVGLAKEIPDFLDRDPAQAAAVAFSLGTAVLLVPELKGHYQRLAQAMRARTSDGGGDGDGSPFLGSSTCPRDQSGTVGDFDALNLADFDAAVFDAFDTGFDAFDTGFDSADGGGGGGGGGGNGGGE